MSEQGVEREIELGSEEVGTLEKNYQIDNWRPDVSRRTWTSKKFEGETLDDCDKKARSWFTEVCKEPALQWDEVALIRIDVPAVAEQLTRLEQINLLDKETEKRS